MAMDSCDLWSPLPAPSLSSVVPATPGPTVPIRGPPSCGGSGCWTRSSRRTSRRMRRWCCWPQTTCSRCRSSSAPPPTGRASSHPPVPPPQSLPCIPELSAWRALNPCLHFCPVSALGRQVRSTGKGVPIPRFRPGCPLYCVGPWAGPGASRAAVFSCGDGKT